jgi:hypothetical protein
MSLAKTTADLLRAVRIRHSLADIAKQSSGAVDHEWLKKFAAGKIADPSVNRIEALHSVLILIGQRVA